MPLDSMPVLQDGKHIREHAEWFPVKIKYALTDCTTTSEQVHRHVTARTTRLLVTTRQRFIYAYSSGRG